MEYFQFRCLIQLALPVVVEHCGDVEAGEGVGGEGGEEAGLAHAAVAHHHAFDVLSHLSFAQDELCSSFEPNFRRIQILAKSMFSSFWGVYDVYA